MAMQPEVPEIIDPIAFQDFRDAVSDYAPQLEQLVCQLGDGSRDSEKVAQLFRILHSIKGDASLCQVHFIEPYVHALETLLDRIRQNELHYQDAVGDVLLLVTDRVVMLLDDMANGLLPDDSLLRSLLPSLDKLAEASAAELPQACAKLVARMMGPAAPPMPTPGVVASGLGGHLFADLQFFRSLAMQFEQRVPEFAGRTERNLTLALEINRLAEKPLSMEQVAAAVYMHDIGMLLLPESLWLKAGRLSLDDRRQMASHPGWAGGLLARMQGWGEAAQMVLQHHESQDGSGYPDGLKGEEICDGACLLALVDAFESVTLKHAQQGPRRSILRGVAELNASERQFHPLWMQLLNQVVRNRLEMRTMVGGR